MTLVKNLINSRTVVEVRMVRDALWVERVVKSCKTMHQWQVADNLVDAFFKKYNHECGWQIRDSLNNTLITKLHNMRES